MKHKYTKMIKVSCQLPCLLGALALFSLGTNKALAVGAVTPFTTMEAESGTLGGGATISSFVLGSPVPTVATKELEASGGAYVVLNATGESVSLVNPVANANAIVIRSSIPDAPNGGGITATINLYVNGVLRQAVTVSSKQSWIYRGATPNPDNPNGGGMPYHFYNEDRAFITGAPIAAGATIKLQKDSANTSSYYDIDCIDLENVPAPLTQPANSLSVTAAPYNADPTFTTDSFAAIQNCINDARTQGKSVWIPQGKYMINHVSGTAMNLFGVAVHGAGVWYSIIYRNVPLPPPTQPWRSELKAGTGTTITDISIDSDAIYKGTGDASGGSSGITSEGDGWLIDHVWVQHCEPQWLSGSNGTIQNSRVSDSWADGINLNNGNTPNSAKTGMNLTIDNCFVRGSGDDGLATYSDAGASGNNSQMDGSKIINSTAIASWWGNTMGVYGGKNVTIQNNLLKDASANNGMYVGIFGTTGQPLESATISGNVIYRGGGWNASWRHGMSIGSSSASTVATITGNTINDSRRAGMFIGKVHENLTIANNVVNHPAVQGFWIESGVSGTGSFNNNAVVNLNAGQTAFQNDSSGTFTATLTGNNWQSSAPVANGTYKAIVRHSGLALDVDHQSTTNGSPLEQWTYNGGNNQRWTLTQIGGNTYKVIGVQSGRALDVPGSSTAAGTLLDIWDWNNAANQMWNITATDSGYNTVVNVNSGKSMEVFGGVTQTNAGAAIDQWNYSTGFNKQWSFQTP